MSDWTLTDLSEMVDVQEDDNRVTKVRNHIVIQIQQQIKSNSAPSRLDIMNTKDAVTYMVGDQWRTNNPAGTGKFICVGDGLAPLSQPLDYVVRKQTWEYYGPWETAPTDWNQ